LTYWVGFSQPLGKGYKSERNSPQGVGLGQEKARVVYTSQKQGSIYKALTYTPSFSFCYCKQRQQGEARQQGRQQRRKEARVEKQMSTLKARGNYPAKSHP